MLPILLSTLIAAAHAASALAVDQGCPTDIASCSKEALDEGISSCCVPRPAGLFVLKQRFEPDVEVEGGKWGIDGLEVLNCDETTATKIHAGRYEHEEIASFCIMSALFGGDAGFSKAEGEWAQSEVGEGVEEVWARSWNTAGRYISTLAPECRGGRRSGEEVAGFFHTLSNIHNRLHTQLILSEADITPSKDTTYSLDLIYDALASRTGYHPVVMCDNITLSSIHWPFVIRNTFQESKFEPAQTELRSNCPKEGIIYPSAQTLPLPTSTGTWDELRRPTPRPITMAHDESRMYYQDPSDDGRAELGGKQDVKRLGLFKMGVDDKEERKEGIAKKVYVRDEL